MFDKIARSDRRSFLRNAGIMFAAMHYPGSSAVLASPRPRRLIQDPPRPRAATPVDFRRFDLRAHKMDEQRRFYAEILHLPIVGDTADSFTVQTGSSQIRFIDDGGAHDRVLCHFAFNIPENQIESAMGWVEQRWPLLRHRRTGKKIVHFRSINARSVYWFDPSGHLLEFIARHDLPNASPGEFDISKLIQASEIGVVTPDVVATCNELEAKTGLSVRPMNKGNTVFAPTGDRHGYFIVVKLDRTWLMTDLPAEHVPIRVVLGAETPGTVKLDGLPFEIEMEAEARHGADEG